jgi:hypothetical protein
MYGQRFICSSHFDLWRICRNRMPRKRTTSIKVAPRIEKKISGRFFRQAK